MYTQEHQESVFKQHMEVISCNEQLIKAIVDRLEGKEGQLTNYEVAKLQLELLTTESALRHRKKAFEDIKNHFESWNKEHIDYMNNVVNPNWESTIEKAGRSNSKKVIALLKNLGANQEKVENDSILKRRYYQDFIKAL